MRGHPGAAGSWIRPLTGARRPAPPVSHARSSGETDERRPRGGPGSGGPAASSSRSVTTWSPWSTANRASWWESSTSRWVVVVCEVGARSGRQEPGDGACSDAGTGEGRSPSQPHDRVRRPHGRASAEAGSLPPGRDGQTQEWDRAWIQITIGARGQEAPSTDYGAPSATYRASWQAGSVVQRSPLTPTACRAMTPRLACSDGVDRPPLPRRPLSQWQDDSPVDKPKGQRCRQPAPLAADCPSRASCSRAGSRRWYDVPDRAISARDPRRNQALVSKAPGRSRPATWCGAARDRGQHVEERRHR